ncbi:MAG: O-antigen ligase family protein [Ruminococcus sp.]|nr:O-antigen ligase family protein [Ruminococcus sp.]
MRLKTSFKLPFNSRLGYNLITIIFLFIMNFTLFNILYWQNEKSAILQLIYRFSLIIVFSCEVFYIGIHWYTRKRFTGITNVAFLYLLYEIIVTVLTNHYGPIGYITDGVVWPLTFVTFELYAMYTDRKVIIKQLHGLIIPSVSVCTVFLINNIRIHLSSSNHGEFGGNVGPVYFCLSFMGLILLLGNKKEKKFFAVWFVIMILASTKRGGFIILMVGLCGYYLVNSFNKGNISAKIKKIFKFAIIGAIIALILYYIMVQLNLEILDRLLSMKDDEGSGRFDAWEKVIRYYNNSGLSEKIFGHGFHSVPSQVQPLGHYIYAHDSYLEALYDFSMVGMLWLIGIVIWLCVQAIKLIKQKDKDAPAIIYTLVEILVLSLIGYFFDESRFILCVAIVWGISLGNRKNPIEQMHNKWKG